MDIIFRDPKFDIGVSSRTNQILLHWQLINCLEAQALEQFNPGAQAQIIGKKPSTNQNPGKIGGPGTPSIKKKGQKGLPGPGN